MSDSSIFWLFGVSTNRFLSKTKKNSIWYYFRWNLIVTQANVRLHFVNEYNISMYNNVYVLA